jgi:hypothetical protein
MMRLDPHKILFGAFAFLAGFLMFFALLASCSTPNPKKQKKHYDKFIYYGGKIDTVKQTKTVEILVKGKDGSDSLIYVDVEVEVEKPVIEYKDRWHIRRMDKAERDSFKHEERMLKLRMKSLEKQQKLENKQVSELAKQAIKQAEAMAKKAKHENKNKWGAWIAIAIVALFIFLLIRFK